MGVINLTPDSFSDGKRAYSYPWWQDVFDIYDIGAESTAPFNQAITENEELDRLEKHLFPLKEKLRGKVLSLDSYKINTMKVFLKEFKGFSIILNDVSGKLEDQYLKILKDNPKVLFVLSHNLAPSRELTSNHMDYTQVESLNLKDYFLDKLLILKKESLSNRVIFDPCFGFSKTTQQNIKLLKNLPRLIRSFDSDIPWLVGISRKRFLRESLEMDMRQKVNQIKVDQLQSILLSKLMDQLPKRKLIMRVHLGESFDQALGAHLKF